MEFQIYLLMVAFGLLYVLYLVTTARKQRKWVDRPTNYWVNEFYLTSLTVGEFWIMIFIAITPVINLIYFLMCGFELIEKFRLISDQPLFNDD